MNILFIGIPMIAIGVAATAKKLIALWAGAVQALMIVAFSRVMGWQDVFGLEFDFGGMMPGWPTAASSRILSIQYAGELIYASM